MKRVIYSFYIDIPKHELDIFDKELPIVKNNKAKPITEPIKTFLDLKIVSKLFCLIVRVLKSSELLINP